MGRDSLGAAELDFEGSGPRSLPENQNSGSVLSPETLEIRRWAPQALNSTVVSPETPKIHRWAPQTPISSFLSPENLEIRRWAPQALIFKIKILGSEHLETRARHPIF